MVMAAFAVAPLMAEPPEDQGPTCQKTGASIDTGYPYYIGRGGYCQTGSCFTSLRECEIYIDQRASTPTPSPPPPTAEKCTADADACDTDLIWDEATQKCRASANVCGGTATWDSKAKKCEGRVQCRVDGASCLVKSGSCALCCSGRFKRKGWFETVCASGARSLDAGASEGNSSTETSTANSTAAPPEDPSEKSDRGLVAGAITLGVLLVASLLLNVHLAFENCRGGADASGAGGAVASDYDGGSIDWRRAGKLSVVSRAAGSTSSYRSAVSV